MAIEILKIQHFRVVLKRWFQLKVRVPASVINPVLLLQLSTTKSVAADIQAGD